MSGEPIDPADALYSDGDAAEALIVQRCFAQLGKHMHLHIARDANRALKFVRRAGGFHDAPDHGSSCWKSTGRRFPASSCSRAQRRRRSHNHLIVIFSSAHDPVDIQRSYAGFCWLRPTVWRWHRFPGVAYRPAGASRLNWVS